MLLLALNSLQGLLSKAVGSIGTWIAAEEGKRTVKQVVVKVVDSVSKKAIPEGTAWEDVVVAVGKEAWLLQLTEESKARVLKALAPFVEGEERVDPRDHYAPRGGSAVPSRGRRSSDAPAPLNAEERARLTAFAAKELKREVSQRGRIASDIREAWEAAGRP